MKIYINGKFYPKGEAKVSVFDHGYLYGDGIYETLRSYDGMVFELDKHIERLHHSARRMFINIPLDDKGLSEAIHDCLRENGLKDAYIRLSLSRGPGEIGLDPELCPEPTVVIIAKQMHDYPKETYECGVKVAVVKTRRNHPESIDPSIKATNFLNNIFAKIEAKAAGAFEGIMLNHAGHVAEGTISNVFIVKAGRLITPPLSDGILEGVTRDLILRLAKVSYIPVSEKPFTGEEMRKSDEAFITNTTMEVMPVTTVDESVISDGRPGPVTLRLRAAYKDEVLRCLRTR